MADWLVKTEPTVYSIDDLKRDRVELWDGVRNYQARNYLKQMREGDRVFIYHSNAKPPGLAGLAQVVAADRVDPTQFDPASPYYDPKATPETPRWHTVKLGYVATFAPLVPLDTLKAQFSPDEFALVRRGNRLSVLPVEGAIAARLLALATDCKET